MPGMPGMPGMPNMESRMAGVLGIPHTRLGSGTSWQPQAAPHYGWHFVRGSWTLMIHGVAYAEYDRQLGARGDDQFGSINWGMLMAMHSLGEGCCTSTACSARSRRRSDRRAIRCCCSRARAFTAQPLHDRQHPHDLFMEAAAHCTSIRLLAISRSRSMSRPWASRRSDPSPFRTALPPRAILSRRSAITGRTPRTSPLAC